MMKGKNAIVTGVANGIGAEVAKMLSAKGIKVTGLDIIETHDNIERFIKFDLSDPKSINSAAELINEDINICLLYTSPSPRD